MTYHVVVAFDRDAEGDLKPGEAQEVMSPIVAERRARALALEHAGALAFSRTGNPATVYEVTGRSLLLFERVPVKKRLRAPAT